MQGRNRRRSAVVIAAVVGLVATVLSGTAPAAAERSRMVNGWFGYWTSPGDVIATAKSSQGVLGEVNIFMWHYAGGDNPVCLTATDGSCDSGATNSRFSESIEGLHDLGIEVYGSHTDLSYSWAGSLSAYMDTRKNRKQLANRLTDYTVQAGLDGVDLDWENFAFNDGIDSWGRTKPRLVKQIKILSKKLHAQGKKLSFTVPGGYQPFRSDGSANPGGGYWVYAWAEVADYVDRLRLMTYDYSWNRPGPIGPHGWTSDAVRSAVRQVGPENKHKIYAGVHQYGKAWYQRDSDDNIVTVGDCPSGWRSSENSDGVALTPAGARELARDYGVRPRFDDDSKEWTFDYNKSEPGTWTNRKGKKKNGSCVVAKQVWFGDKETAVARANIVKNQGIGGLSVWQLPSVGKDFFAALKPFVGGGDPAPKPPRLKLKPLPTTAAAGVTVKLKGKLRPKASGVKVRGQAFTNGKWRTKGVDLTSERGRIKVKVKLPQRLGEQKFRLKSAKSDQHPRLTSEVVTVQTVK